jgi:hypothetical protein
MKDDHRQTIRDALRTLATTHAIAIEQMERMIAVLNLALETDEPDRSGLGPRSSANANLPTANRETLSVVWRGNSCFLGNTLLFWFFERIARSPNRYVAHVDLLEDVWGGERKDATIRGVAKRLRDRLAENGMQDLAGAIDGSVPGYYGLILV